ncbi:N-acetylglucosamine kinase [Photobacterium rosenbergii]|uniref:N-acetylglucosamine kinase n=1 Tax=Photobacterium rosenbergii TaxID=294936 RepID=A0A2T3MXN4_9GAMM|nr:BadF/BadG/BcrA/BcrD ATPase family protein [Photobacterium rosenbergii]PSW04746.1 N-acetylglucosamine kinase [Photobacterium rosenbergii]
MTDPIRYFVGVDGGGTSCRARITDINGHILGEAKTGSANILLGADIAMASIIDAIATAATIAGLNEESYSSMSVGLALAGAEQQSAWYEFMAQPHPFGAVTLNTDAYGACLGAWGGGDGAILIAGTGSCGILLKDSEQHVVGGREFPISDQGGGAVMGLRLIQQTLLAHDGIRPITPLAEHVLSHFNHDIDAIVSWSKSARPCDYGQFSPAIFAEAYRGDSLGIELLNQTAADIEMWMKALVKRGAEQICLMGSIAERIQPWLIPPMQQRVATPMGDAMDGALAMARSSHNLYPL